MLRTSLLSVLPSSRHTSISLDVLTSPAIGLLRNLYRLACDGYATQEQLWGAIGHRRPNLREGASIPADFRMARQFLECSAVGRAQRGEGGKSKVIYPIITFNYTDSLIRAPSSTCRYIDLFVPHSFQERGLAPTSFQLLDSETLLQGTCKSRSSANQVLRPWLTRSGWQLPCKCRGQGYIPTFSLEGTLYFLSSAEFACQASTKEAFLGDAMRNVELKFAMGVQHRRRIRPPNSREEAFIPAALAVLSKIAIIN